MASQLTRAVLAAGVIALTPLAQLADARTANDPPVVRRVHSTAHHGPRPADLRASDRSPSRAAAVVDTFLLAWYSFDSRGLADPQGWTSVDRTLPVGAPFHVADATELDGGASGALTPLSGAQSLWCGVAPSATSPYCSWGSLPGYGNSWVQSFESVSFAVTGDVLLSYKVRWDSEAGYDETRVQYRDATGSTWVNVAVNSGIGFYDGAGDLVESIVIPAAAHTGSLTLRFHFVSDGAWSDEDGLHDTDGAVLVDDIVITDGNGTVDTQTFESESPGDITTADGDWSVESSPPSFGDFAALYPGTSVLQENPCFRETDFVWGFFDDPATTSYNCFPQHPEQGAIRRGHYIGNQCFEIANEIWSPAIPVSGSGAEYLLSFRVYRDLSVDGNVFYTWNVRSRVNDCWEPWETAWPLYFGTQRDWLRQVLPVGQFVDPAATDVQVALGVIDLCSLWCFFGCGDYESCHTHAPLFDDVYVLRIDNPAPQFVVHHVDLFQDNFAEDGTLTGTARADAAQDILPGANGNITPGDSLTATIVGGPTPIAPDPCTGVGPAAYVYVAVWPPGQPGKSGADIEAPEGRAIGTRFPLADVAVHEGTTWYCFRMDTCITPAGDPVADCYAFDLNDNVFTPGDTICYVLAATNAGGASTYFSRRLNGQGLSFVTEEMNEALASPMEFTILPAGGYARGGTYLYVDDADDRGAQLYFDTAFDILGVRDEIDRYDVLGPSSAAGNSLASRVTDVAVQLQDPYRTIFWNTGNLSYGLIGDGGPANGGGGMEKSDDWSLLFAWMDTHADHPGIYFSGDDLASDWANRLTGSGAVSFRTTYMSFDLDPAGATYGDNSHVYAGEPVSPVLSGVGCAEGDRLLAYGGCPTLNDFDLLVPTGFTTSLYENALTGKRYVLHQSTTNSAGTPASVVLSGFSFDRVRDFANPIGYPERAIHMEHIRGCLIGSPFPIATGREPVPVFANQLHTAYPNPFNPSTTIRYTIKEPGHVRLVIYNAAGQRVRALVNEIQQPRPEGFIVDWQGRNDGGNLVSSGVYFYRLVTKNFTATRKVVMLK